MSGAMAYRGAKLKYLAAHTCTPGKQVLLLGAMCLLQFHNSWGTSGNWYMHSLLLRASAAPLPGSVPGWASLTAASTSAGADILAVSALSFKAQGLLLPLILQGATIKNNSF